MGWPMRKRSMMAEVITDPLLEDILSRVPVKSIVRFWCVSQHWFNLTHNPYFIHMHHRNCPAQSQLRIALIEEEDGVGNIGNCRSNCSDVCCSTRLRVYSLMEDDTCTLTNTFACKCNQRLFPNTINGMLCAPEYFYQRCFLLNPTTNESVSFPTTTTALNRFDVCSWGFGFHPGTRKYKFLRITQLHTTPPQSRIEVCSPGESWRALGLTRHDFPPLSTCIDGVIYWSTGSEKEKNQYILAFDLGEEMFRLIKPPNCEGGSHICVDHLHEFDGKLCFECHHYNVSSRDRIEVWACIDLSRNTWIKMYSICFETFGRQFTSDKIVLLLWVSKEKALVRIGRKRLFCYYFLTKTWKLVAEFKSALSYSPFAAYMETLSCPSS